MGSEMCIRDSIQRFFFGLRELALPLREPWPLRRPFDLWAAALRALTRLVPLIGLALIRPSSISSRMSSFWTALETSSR